ncbi:hypothetical protein A3H89_04885 [Candidatus Amesbacteria bacterium RIFCSPLOWO2_02_FULL_48_11]|uniref:Shikimate dehydrogenase substrate binding N-terminal domain-containing protein n=5 Tax=Candidatus Amesiibacteriota TaxID=1752730 RepID=A0A1F4Z403_9BACT|nr:MAG: Shikimate dehydrogenase [Candidatus Amesbacteria bacterium GW2011_GWA2_47_11]KKU95105.1 MAG: Shikimate dehydrogenase [Candidatus Amesbacteria bacterium GW2011_GWC1_48_10]KKU99803.1 MAG: Shikimate dehydrogenase [Candidatus Amesbacteria bacterium GW2011_GWA1_48_9]OGC89824.1 MAG: hypothetical protein A2V48_04355 [Candidatus Amesbacteria bacterium RBG_19FT_COMBO_48_16]OGC95912.1 MAG: hypothetical protein A3C34_01915 [Candidatus Amesbacteria bacterium RIFCSPHIGHO2_02_FULL_48_21]OGC96883.1 M
MINDGNTKVIARLHKQLSPRALNIYNPFFEEAGINAVFLLFYNSDPKPLVDGIKNLNFSGAVTVGFETDADFAKLVDEHDESSRIVNRVGFIKNENGKLKGYYQGGKGQLLSVQSVTSVAGKELVIVGAGNVVKSLLSEISKLANLPKSVIVLNRTISKLEEFNKYNFVKEVGEIKDISSIRGDVLINATHLGGSVVDNIFTEKVVRNFNAVSDVTFETEDTNLITIARKLKKKNATGWDMFTYQGLVVLETILDIKIDPQILKRHVIAGLSQTVK